MEGTTIFMCNENGEVLEDGNIGEIYIGGLGVGAGYLDESLNLNRFVRLCDFPNEIFYRTGDIAFKDEAGRIICLGRNDTQIKVRGNRVELTDIEACILKFKPNVSNKVECMHCLLDSLSTNIDEDGICDVCRFFEANESSINELFNNSRSLESVIHSHTQDASKYDCMLLYSGGRDSTYVLIRLVEMGFDVLAYTFDNGYLSQQALENIERITSTLGVDSVIEKFSKIDNVFSESLKKFSTVCDGCYRVLTTMSTQYALDKGISTIITGLDKGQIIETKLMRVLDKKGINKSMDELLSDQRRVYHFWDNSFDSYLNTINNLDGINNINFVDFYLHEDVNEEAIWNCIEKNGLWRKSQDTGLCSSNCLINDVGIFAHFRDKGFHNYAAPLSWDVRLNRICRSDGKAKLSTQMLDIQYIESMLNHFKVRNAGGVCNCSVLFKDEKILAFIQSSQSINIKLLQEFVRNTLPPYMLPHKFILIDEIPLTESGKVDSVALLSLLENNPIVYQSDDGSIEAELSKIWSNILGHSDFTKQDNFFDVGGDSLDAIMMSSEIEEQFNFSLQFGEIVEKLSISWIANQIKSAL